MRRHSPLVLAALLCASCGRSDAPEQRRSESAVDDSWTARREAQSRVYDVVRAAYYYMIDNPERTSATTAEVTARNTRPEYERARKAATDPWGKEIRLRFRSQWFIVATSAGPDGLFDNDDDLSANTGGWQ
jgi:hypothetical protein